MPGSGVIAGRTRVDRRLIGAGSVGGAERRGRLIWPFRRIQSDGSQVAECTQGRDASLAAYGTAGRC